ncbi:hypothetical protein J2W56_004261 [Nocardia kruczakiae]|uniref:Uncharacterized protein n=1 Tax=Nocardia kruczakiae TaxID=261477 RepID=A0ABU1XIZ1_9NOCA|nr:hypothetical protein [Nocardia kruczakiae]MDR7170510.1 hypothetical protein [Nocardia kruczakiae]
MPLFSPSISDFSIVTEVTHRIFDAAVRTACRSSWSSRPIPCPGAPAQKLLDPAALERWIAQYSTFAIAD